MPRERHHDESAHLSEDEIQSFASKLEQWSQELPPAEQALMQLLLGRAATAEDKPANELLSGGNFMQTSISDRATQALQPLLRGRQIALMRPGGGVNWSSWGRG